MTGNVNAIPVARWCARIDDLSTEDRATVVDALACEVRSCKESAAAAINNAGPRAQLPYLLEHTDVREVGSLLDLLGELLRGEEESPRPTIQRQVWEQGGRLEGPDASKDEV